MHPTLLIDADFFFYRAAQASEMEQEYSPDLTVIVGDFRRGKKTFRKGVDENYKGNRTKRKPCGYLKLKNWGLDKYPSLIMPNLEADDALGIAATSGKYKNFVLISPDKDMHPDP